MNSPNIIVLNAPCSSFFVVFPCFYASHFFFDTVVSFSAELLLLCKEKFRVQRLSCKLRNTARKIYKHCTRSWSKSWKRTVKIAHICFIFGTTKIIAVNLPLLDKSLYACSFFCSRAGKLADCFINDATSRFIFCDTTEKMLPISPLFAKPLLRQQAELFVNTSNRNLQMWLESSRKGEVLYLVFHGFP